MKKIAILLLFFSIVTLCFCFAQTASHIERTQGAIEQEKALREKIEKGEKFFIKRITVEGVTLLTEEEIKEIILPLERQWLSEVEIQQILDSITSTYKQKGCPEQPAKISSQINRGVLKIKVQELRH